MNVDMQVAEEPVPEREQLVKLPLTPTWARTIEPPGVMAVPGDESCTMTLQDDP